MHLIVDLLHVYDLNGHRFIYVIRGCTCEVIATAEHLTRVTLPDILIQQVRVVLQLLPYRPAFLAPFHRHRNY